VRVEGQFTVNGTMPMLNAALGGVGLAYVPDDLAQSYPESGALIRVLEDWCQRTSWLSHPNSISAVYRPAGFTTLNWRSHPFKAKSFFYGE
jgi:DNA-binding transcriptional LysR family regulator